MKIDLRFPRIESMETYGPSGRLMGYSAVIHNLGQALTQIGVELAPRNTAEVVVQITPPFLYEPTPGRIGVCYTMWESNKLPNDNKAVFDADMLIVPSSFCRSVFRNAGYHKPIVVVPLGVWEDDWPMARERQEDDVRRFLWVGAPDPRKGFDLLERAWAEAFAPDERRVHLTVKTTPEPGVPELGVSILRRYARCLFVAERYSWADLKALYLMHDVFLFPSLAEGFGLPVLEAMAAGLLVITPNHTGLREFVHRGVAWVVETTKARAHYGGWVDISAPKVSHLKALLRQAVDGYDATADLRARARAHALQFIWERTAQGVAHAIERYAGRQVA